MLTALAAPCHILPACLRLQGTPTCAQAMCGPPSGTMLPALPALPLTLFTPPVRWPSGKGMTPWAQSTSALVRRPAQSGLYGEQAGSALHGAAVLPCLHWGKVAAKREELVSTRARNISTALQVLHNDLVCTG